MKRVEPMRLGEIIESMMAQYTVDPDVRRTYICGLWHKVAGEAISHYTRRVSLEGRTMHVFVDSASLKEMLGYLRGSLTEKINAAAGSYALDDIIIH